jgi:ABC-2 type transport system permease protein
LRISRIAPMMRKEALHIFRDPRSLYLALVFPVLLLVVLGLSITFDIRHVAIGIVDHDGSPAGRDLIGRLKASEYFSVKEVTRDEAEGERLIRRDKAKIVLVIPVGFGRSLAKGETAKIQVLVDGTNNNTAQVALGYLGGLFQSVSTRILLETAKNRGLTEIPGIEPRTRVWYNPELRSTNFIVPGVIAVIMMIVSTMLTSLTIAREWEMGTMEQLIASPARAAEIVIGKAGPYFILGLLQMALIVIAARILFRVPFKGSVLTLLLSSSLFLLCGLGVGLFISTISRSQQLSFMLGIILTMMPSFILSGFIFPIPSLPWAARIVSYFVPARYFLTIVRGIFLKGNGLAVHGTEFLALGIFAVLIFLATARRLKLRLE